MILAKSLPSIVERLSLGPEEPVRVCDGIEAGPLECIEHLFFQSGEQQFDS